MVGTITFNLVNDPLISLNFSPEKKLHFIIYYFKSYRKILEQISNHVTDLREPDARKADFSSQQLITIALFLTIKIYNEKIIETGILVKLLRLTLNTETLIRLFNSI